MKPLATLLCLLLPTPFARAQDAPPAWPDSHGGRVARAWLDAVAAGTDDAAIAFERAHRDAAQLAQRSAEERAAGWRSLRRQLGDLRPLRVLADAPDRFAFLIEASAAPVELRVELRFAATPPHGVVGLEIRPAAPERPPLGDYDGWSDVRDLLTRVCADAGVPAMSAAVLVDGEIVAAEAVGLRALGRDEAVTRDDRFHIGSVTKSVTATLIGALVERGTLRFDTTLGAVLEDVPMRDEYRDVTLAQLLRHRGGLQPWTRRDPTLEATIEEAERDPVARRRALARVALQQEPAAPPGQEFVYSNAGYALAAHVAEVVAQKPWETLLQELVFAPLGMQTALVGWPFADGREAEPRGHFDGPGPLRAQAEGEYDLGSHLAPAGDVSCSATDLLRFARLHLDGLGGKDGALRSATIRTLHEPGDGADYAAGWRVAVRNGVPVHEHSGSAGTFLARLTLEPENGLAVVVFANAGAPAEAAVDKVSTLLRTRHRPRR